MTLQKGTLYFITGFSGAGKTTIGSMLFEYMRSKKNNVVFLDGDACRKAYGMDIGYTKEDRMAMTFRNAGLHELLLNQGMDIIFCAIGLSDEIRKVIIDHEAPCKIIYLKVSHATLIQRDYKGVYANKEVYGVDLSVQEPKNPDVLVENDGDITPEQVCKIIIESLSL